MLEMAIFDVVTMLPQCALMGWYNTRLVKMEKRKRYVVINTVVMLLAVFLFDLGLINGMIRMSFVFGGSLILAGAFARKKERIVSEIIVFIHFFITNMCEGIVALLYYFGVGDENYELFFQPNHLILNRVVFLGGYIIAAQCLCYVVQKVRKEYVRREINVYAWILALQLIVLVLFMGDYSGRAISNVFNMWLIMILCLFCILMDMTIYFLLKEIERNETEKYQANQLSMQVKYQTQREKELQDDIYRAEQIKKNLLEGIESAKEMMAEKNDEATSKRLKKLEKDVVITAESMYCHNRVLDALLSEKVRLCEQKCIHLETGIEIGNEIEKEAGIQNADLCVIVGNLLDNAIRACEKKNAMEDGTGIVSDTKPYIRFMVKRKGRYLVFHQENTADNIVENRREGLLSEHGLGLGILERIAEKYGGYLETERKEGVFHTFVMLHMNEE